MIEEEDKYQHFNKEFQIEHLDNHWLIIIKVADKGVVVVSIYNNNSHIDLH